MMADKELLTAVLSRIKEIYPEKNNTTTLIQQIATIAATVCLVTLEEYEKMKQ